MIISEAIAATESAATHAHEAEVFYASPEFWVSAAFVIVVVSFAKPIAKILKKVTSERAQKISDKIDDARRLKDEAAELLAEYERRFKDAEAEAAAIVAKAKENAARFKKEAEEAMNLALAKKEEQAFDKIKSAETGASEEIRAHVIDVGTKTTVEVISGALKNQVTAQMLAASLKELPVSLQKLA
jgi:F-type H+-transporting ATPase subunit b